MSEKRKINVEESSKKKTNVPKKSYVRKVPTKWLNDPKYSSWLSPSHKNKNKAFCNACDSELTSSIVAIERHNKTDKHFKNTNKVISIDQKYEIVIDNTEVYNMDFDYNSIKIGFIGAGNMTQALLGGFIKKGLTIPSNAYVSAPSRRNLDKLVPLGVNTTSSNGEVVRTCDLVFLSVKPHLLFDAILSVGQHPCYKDGPVFISLAAGIKLDKLESMLSNIHENPTVIRVVPNTPCLVSEGCCVFSRGTKATDYYCEMLKGFLSSVSIVEELSEYQLNAACGLSGSGPAYIYAAIEAMADGGVKMGLPRELALKFAAQTVRGAATMVLETGKHPGVLKDEVCSPGGTTIAAMHSLEKTGLRNSLISAVEASATRAKEL